MAADEQNERFKHGAEIMRQIGNASPPPGRQRFPNLPPEQADDMQRKLVEFCFGETWGREGSHLDLKTRRLLTIAVLTAMGRERQLHTHIRDALKQGVTREEIVEAIVHLVAYCGFPASLTSLEIANEVFGQQK